MKLVTPKFRGSYAHLMKPNKIGDGEPRYGIVIVLPKEKESTKTFIADLKKMMKAALEEKFNTAIPFERCKHFPLKDGDEEVDDEGNPHEEWRGCWIIHAHNSRQPGILVREEDGTRRSVESPEEIYSGAYYHASITAYAWKHESGGKGVSISLSGVLKVGDGEKFSAGSFDESDFDEVSEPGEKKAARKSDEDERPAKKKRDADF